MVVPTQVQAERDEEARIDARRADWERGHVTDCDECGHCSFVITAMGGSSYGEIDEGPWIDGYCSCNGGEEGDECNCTED